jgi:hypothetical protein
MRCTLKCPVSRLTTRVNEVTSPQASNNGSHRTFAFRRCSDASEARTSPQLGLAFSPHPASPVNASIRPWYWMRKNATTWVAEFPKAKNKESGPGSLQVTDNLTKLGQHIPLADRRSHIGSVEGLQPHHRPATRARCAQGRGHSSSEGSRICSSAVKSTGLRGQIQSAPAASLAFAVHSITNRSRFRIPSESKR